MSNIGGLRAVLVVALLALVCKAGLAQIGPRYLIDLKGAGGGALAAPAVSGQRPGQRPGQGRVQLVGKGLTLIRFQGLRLLTVGADADAYSAESVRDWPAVDVVLVTPPSVGRYGGLAPLAALRKLPVILVEPAGGLTVSPLPSASALSSSSSSPRSTPAAWRGAAPTSPAASAAAASSAAGPDDGPRYYPMQTWDSLHLRLGNGNGNGNGKNKDKDKDKDKDKTWLRVTAMPGQPGTAHVAGFVLEMGDSQTSYRLYVSCEALDADEIDGLFQRLPGADLALLPAGDAPRLLPLRRAAHASGRLASPPAGGPAAAPPAASPGEPATLTAAGYRFSAVRR